jgi:hypothetical protein
MKVKPSPTTLIWCALLVGVGILITRDLLGESLSGVANDASSLERVIRLPRGLAGAERPVESAPLPAKDPLEIDTIPADALPLEPGDYGLRGLDGQAQPAANVADLSCVTNSLMRVETSEGTFFVGIGPAAPVDCRGAITRWQSAQGGPSKLALRFQEANGPTPPMVTLLGERSSVQFAAEGLWRSESS